jgi:hypothetical protein
MAKEPFTAGDWTRIYIDPNDVTIGVCVDGGSTNPDNASPPQYEPIVELWDGRHGIPPEEVVANGELIKYAPRMYRACRAHLAWELAEESREEIATFNERMDLCNYAQWLTRQALGGTEEFSGVPHIFISVRPLGAEIGRLTIQKCEELIERIFQATACNAAESTP